jgi:acylphosphatase
MPTYRIHFSGQVQGVGFRATCQWLARQLPALAGYVSNLHDGRVRLIVRGSAADVARLVERLQDTFPDHIHDIEQTELPPGNDPLPADLSGVQITRGH